MLNILPICYQIIFTDCLLFFKLLHNCYDFDINDYVTVSESRPGNKSSQRMVFSVPLTRKFCSLGSFFQRTFHSINSVLAKIDINSTTTVSQTKTLLFNFLKQQLQSTFNLDNPCTFFIKCRILCAQSQTTQASGYSQWHVLIPLLVSSTPDTSLSSPQSIAAPVSSSPRRGCLLLMVR